MQSVLAAYPSQCTTDQNGTQVNCETTESEKNAILDQCLKSYNASVCGSVSSYVSYMSDRCKNLNPRPQGINCDVIASNGIYGNEAAKFAEYLEKNSTAAAATTSGTKSNSKSEDPWDGTLNFPTNFNLPDPQGGVVGVLATFLNWILGIISVIAMIALVVSGLQYFWAAGDEKMAETAKRNMTYSIIGIIVALAGFIIVKAVDALLRANTLF